MRNENSASKREQRMLAFYAEREQNRRSQMRYWKAEGFVCICGLLTNDKLCVCRPLVPPCRQILAECL